MYSIGIAYLVDATPGRGPSVASCGQFGRNLAACVLSFAASPMVRDFGAGTTTSVFAGLTVLVMSVMLLLKFKGEAIRKISFF
jgi:hypothetical protein